MKFTSTLTIIGMKASKGTLENGNAYDSTKVYTLVDLDASKGTAKGAASAEYTLGVASEFDKFKHLPFPFKAEVDLEIVTNGKTQKTVMHEVRPTDRVKPGQAA
ncbi:hypothetical protein [Xylophilus ampelinus]|uniref:Uncharacterized protein n=1 Tax=Xylophilus ampelinus TaxID=54067 RepID=A0A318SCJ3_9BURK|nr:hypothetical protein [Xylophilus ampelinus]MCS4511876.1 hypothetical protein [Xylophilus ampelinus]PYE73014.1 hypothetical protein DFQ15_1412 [Xylophilus ampelinus]